MHLACLPCMLYAPPISFSLILLPVRHSVKFLVFIRRSKKLICMLKLNIPDCSNVWEQSLKFAVNEMLMPNYTICF
jgi:hypothetical protein